MKPDLHFRVRKNGVAVFRVREAEDGHRIELKQIAVIKSADGAIKPHGKNAVSAEERVAIEDWIAARARLEERELSPLEQLCDAINRGAQFVQADAKDEELEASEARLLMSIHDLRSTLVRRLGKQARRRSN